MLPNRRDFLVRGSAAPWIATGMSWPLLAAEPMKPAFPGMIVRSAEPQNLEYPFAALDGSITPNDQFYVRNHFKVPAVDAKTWKLTVEGSVKQKLELTHADLLKLPARAITATLECAGNGRVFLTPGAGGTQWGQGAVGNAEWTGVSLAAILEKSGLKDDAVEVVLEGADKGQINSDPKSPGPISFARSLSIAKARHDSVILAYKMNGDELPASHGYPLRAIVAGWYGMASVKWLSRIVVVDKPFQGFFQSLDYAIWERKNGLPTLAPLTKMEVKSAIARPALSEEVSANKTYRIYGAKTWANAKLIDKPAALKWCLWEFNWQVPVQAGRVRLMARATDADGKSQPLERNVDRRNYMINHVVPVEVNVR
jgi:DMSO/TMAO reductase YedYZ molybdopterin-dependent catalytic subunit